MPDLDLNGVRLFYQQAGDGPDVVLVHAVTSNLASWMFGGLFEELSEDFRVTCYDLRGHGHSAAPPTGYTSADMADDLLRLHAALGLGPAWLIGHSFGGVVALHAAVLAPERVAGVILSDSYFPGLRHIEPHFERANVWQDLQDTFRQVGVEIGDRLDLTRLFQIAAGLTPEQWAKLTQWLGAFGKGWLVQLPRLAATSCGEDVMAVAGLTADAITSVTRPVVALYDEHSPFLATARYLEARLPRCTVEIVPGAKHLAPVQNAATFNAAVRRLLKGTR